jgi:hypothetical protein
MYMHHGGQMKGHEASKERQEKSAARLGPSSRFFYWTFLVLPEVLAPSGKLKFEAQRGIEVLSPPSLSLSLSADVHVRRYCV